MTTGGTPLIEITECMIDWCAKIYYDANVSGRQFSASVREYLLLYSGLWKEFSIIGPVQPEFSLPRANRDLPAGLNLTFTVQRTNAKSLATFLVNALRSGNLTESSGCAGIPEIQMRTGKTGLYSHLHGLRLDKITTGRCPGVTCKGRPCSMCY